MEHASHLGIYAIIKMCVKCDYCCSITLNCFKSRSIAVIIVLFPMITYATSQANAMDLKDAVFTYFVADEVNLMQLLLDGLASNLSAVTTYTDLSAISSATVSLY